MKGVRLKSLGLDLLGDGFELGLFSENCLEVREFCRGMVGVLWGFEAVSVRSWVKECNLAISELSQRVRLRMGKKVEA